MKVFNAKALLISTNRNTTQTQQTSNYNSTQKRHTHIHNLRSPMHTDTADQVNWLENLSIMSNTAHSFNITAECYLMRVILTY